MSDHPDWDWQLGAKTLADIRGLRSRFAEVHELSVSPDGESIAVPVKTEDGAFTACVNGEPWEATFEKVWYLKYSPLGRLTALVMADDQWTLALDGVPWEKTFAFVWNTCFSGDGQHVAAQIKDGMSYGLAVDGVPWEETFTSMREFALSDDGSLAAATVQTVPMKEGDIATFEGGTWSLAVNGKAWDRNYLNVYSPVISRDGQHVAAQVRTAQYAYTVAVDERPWSGSFGCTWDPLFRPTGSSVLVPVMRDGWTVAEDGDPLWNGRYNQLWRLRLGPDGKRLAAVVAVAVGKWTVAVDDVPWGAAFSDAVLDPHFSPQGDHVAAVVRNDGKWSMAVDGKPWGETFDMIWDPVFDPTGQRVACKVERDGRFTLALDGRLWTRTFEALWQPVFSPDGSKLLVRAIEDGKYVRTVVRTEEVA